MVSKLLSEKTFIFFYVFEIEFEIIWLLFMSPDSTNYSLVLF